MNIEFEKLKEVCREHTIMYTNDLCLRNKLECTEANCPLNAGDRVCQWVLRGAIFYTDCKHDISDNMTSFMWHNCPYCGKALEILK